MTDDSRPSFSRYAHVIPLDEGELGMLPEHRQRRRINAARRLGRIHINRKARELGMIATDWQEQTIEGAGYFDDARMAVRVSAQIHTRPVAFPTELTDAINTAIAERNHADGLSIPHRFIAGENASSSAEAFRAWEAPRRAAYQAARDAAIARLEPAFEQLGRMIDDIANPPRYIVSDEEHVITADQLAEVRPTAWVPMVKPEDFSRVWITSTANEVEPHRHALELLDELGALLDAMHTGPDMRGRATNLTDVLHHHLDAVRRLVLHHHDIVDPAGADARARARRSGRRCHCGAIEWPPLTAPTELVRRDGWAHTTNPVRGCTIEAIWPKATTTGPSTA